MGSTSENVYIVFVCENAAFLSWGYHKPAFLEQQKVQFFSKPLKLTSKVKKLEILKHPPSSIIEGEKFAEQSPIIQVKGKNIKYNIFILKR